MESAGHDKKGTSAPPKFTMRTRRQVAEEKRKVEEEDKRVKEAKRRKEMFEPRENEDVKPQDIILDSKLMKIYIDHFDEEKEVKEEVILEDAEEDGGLQAWSSWNPGIQQDVNIEDERLEATIEENDLDATIEENDLDDTIEENNLDAAIEENNLDATIEKNNLDATIEKNNLDAWIEKNDLDAWIDDGQMDIMSDCELGAVNEVVEEAVMNNGEHLVDKILPSVLPFLNQNDIFRCRLLNKQYLEMVDEFIEDSVVPRQYDNKAYLQRLKKNPSQLCPLPKFRTVKYAYRFESERLLEIFNERMAPHVNSESSPFVGGATVTLKNLFILSSILSSTTKMFLENFGVHIRRLVIQQGGEEIDFDIVGFVKCVKMCLHYVPNLERLKIIGNRMVKWDQSKLAKIQLELYRNEMLDRTPKLKKLDSLEFEYTPIEDCQQGDFDSDFCCWPYLEETLIDIMIKPYYQNQLKNYSSHRPNKLYNLKFDNLKELSLVNLLYPLRKIPFQSPVEKLTFSYIWVDDLVNISKRFPHLKYLSSGKRLMTKCSTKFENIHTLEITDTGIRDTIQAENLNKTFPKLRYLIIRFRKLDCEYEYVAGDSNNGNVKVADLVKGGSTYNSNIWTVLPQLEIFTFQFQVHDFYSREGSKCNCKFVKGTKEECRFKNVVETRAGYQRYQEGVPGLITAAAAKGCSFYIKARSSASSRTGSIDPQLIPLVLPFLNQKDVLNCRRISKLWRQIVDNFIEGFVTPLKYYDNKAYLEKVKNSPNKLYPVPKFRNVKFAYHFKSKRILNLFNEKMASHINSELSPFVGGATVILDDLFFCSFFGTPSPVKFFLERFGVHIRNLVIQQTEEFEMDVVNFVECVQICFLLVPNLNGLKIIGKCPDEYDKVNGTVYRNELLYRIPRFTNLDTLELEFSYAARNFRKRLLYLDKIFDGVLVKPFEAQLNNLQISGALPWNRSLEFCNLKQLTLQIWTCNPRNLIRGKELKIPAEKLTLNIGDPQMEFSNLDDGPLEICRILRIFPFLGYLKLENQIGLCFSYFEPNLPSNTIHTLELEGTEKFDLLPDSVLRVFPKLRFLIINNAHLYKESEVKGDKESSDCQIDTEYETGGLQITKLFYGGTSFDTNIWQVLPELEVFTFQFQDHLFAMRHWPESEGKRCHCHFVKGTKYECPFKNLVETREGYERYHERLSRLMKQIK